MKFDKLFGIAAIIFALGYFMSSLPSAEAYPQGPSVSLGSNPIFSMGGDSSGTLLTVPSDQSIVISDVVLGASGSGSNRNACTGVVNILNSSNTILASFRLSSDTSPYYSSQSNIAGQLSHQFGSGILVQPNDSLSIDISGNCTINYTISGYYAQP